MLTPKEKENIEMQNRVLDNLKVELQSITHDRMIGEIITRNIIRSAKNPLSMDRNLSVSKKPPQSKGLEKIIRPTGNSAHGRVPKSAEELKTLPYSSNLGSTSSTAGRTKVGNDVRPYSTTSSQTSNPKTDTTTSSLYDPIELPVYQYKKPSQSVGHEINGVLCISLTTLLFVFSFAYIIFYLS